MHDTQPYEQLLIQLVDLLDSVVHDQVGEALAGTMQRIRRLALERRAGIPDAESRLVAELQRLERHELRSVIRWLSLFFDLANLVEDLQRVNVLRHRDAKAREAGVPRGESIAEAVASLRDQGCTTIEVQQWLNRLCIEPVFTAHPSEAKRRTIRQLLRSVRSHLPQLRGADSQQAQLRFLADLTVLWQSDLVRPQRPPVMSEVSRGLFFTAVLWDVVPEVYRELREALSTSYPQHRFDIPTFIRFGSWIGGDRDGHPYVTADITRRTLARLKRAGLESHLAQCQDMLSRLVMSDQQVPSSEQLREQIHSAMQRWPDLAERLETISEFETYRRFLKVVEYRLQQTLASVTTGEDHSAQYNSADEFRTVLRELYESLALHRGESIAVQMVQPWIDRLETFGFHFAALDIRQNSEVHRHCLGEILSLQEIRVEELSAEELQNVLLSAAATTPVESDQLSGQSREVLETFLLLADEIAQWGLRPIGGYIISMTHSPVDVLTVLWLWRLAWRTRHPEAPLPYLPIVPLFETVNDLQQASQIMERLFEVPDYAHYVMTNGDSCQTVMVGYSDSTKDGGYLSACWELHRAQTQLADVADHHHVELTIFHGRGGALGRGGGPAARAIRSLPARAVNGRLRVTEQGEVPAERYDDARIAHRHLEQIISATLLVSVRDDGEIPQVWSNAMSAMGDSSLAKYRSLVEHPKFLAYFDQATPISEIETLPIGSRPARRGQRQSLGDLRAIPWTFAWTQSRHLIPAWFGFGTAVRSFIDEQDQDWAILRAMYQQWPMFRALVDNAELALAKADMHIARKYAQLLEDPAAQDIWAEISAEFDRSRGAVLIITDGHELLAGTGWLNRSIQKRNPYVDPLNFTQIHLLQQRRATDGDAELQDLLRLTIQGIASGLRTTG